MLNPRTLRFDPAELSRAERAALETAVEALGELAVVEVDGTQATLPPEISDRLGEVLRWLAEGTVVTAGCEALACTTQAAADFLGVSRQHLVDLLERGALPHHKVGAHRRVHFEDLLAYQQERATQEERAVPKVQRSRTAAAPRRPRIRKESSSVTESLPTHLL